VHRSSRSLWGVTVARLGLQRFTGQIRMDPAHPQHCIAFDRGFIVGATSPLATDSVTRVALTGHLITANQVPEIQKRLAAAAGRDEADMLAEAARIGAERAVALRRRLVMQRAARTFSLDTSYSVEERITIPRHATCEVDVRAVVFAGALGHLSPERLAQDLRQLAARFKLAPKALRDVPRFELPEAAAPVVDTIRVMPTSLPELEALHRDVDPRLIQAVVYALLACEACIFEQPRKPSDVAVPPPERIAKGTTGSLPLPRPSSREIDVPPVVITADLPPLERTPRATANSEPLAKPGAELPPMPRVRIPESKPRVAMKPLARPPRRDTKTPPRTVTIPRTKTKKPPP
jgi:hypothetical protein